MSGHLPKFHGLAAVVVLTLAATGCATYEHCGFEGCPGDASLTANVQARFNQRPDLGPPNSIDVQTLNHVVYLYGPVSTGLQRQEAASVARGVPGVKRVVNSIDVVH